MGGPYRVGMLHYSCPPVVGGVEEVLSQQGYVLSRMGHRVGVLAGMGEEYTSEVQVHLNPLFGSQDARVRAANRKSRAGDHALTEALGEEIYKELKKWAKDRQVIIAHNVLHMHFNLALTLALARLARTKGAPPIVSWAHDSPHLRPRLPPYLRQGLWQALVEPLPGVTYVTVSSTRKALFERHLGDFDWRVIPNGIDPVRFFYLSQASARLAQETRLFNRDMVVVQPARITPRKNMELAIRIIHGIKTLGFNILFLLTGAYDPHESAAKRYTEDLHRLIQELDMTDHVVILAEYTFKNGRPLVPEQAFIRDLYMVADLLLMTSLDEGFGLPLLEAGLSKVPIAASEIPAFVEVGEEVCFFRLQDPPMFIAGRIMEYLSTTRTHRMFRRVMRDYIWDTICRTQLVPLLDEIAARPPKR